MTVATEIDRLIRVVKSGQQAAPDEFIARVDAEGNRLRGLRSKFSKNREYAFNPKCLIELSTFSVSIKNFRADQLFSVPVRLELGIEDEDAVFAALAEDHQRSIFTSVQDWITDALRDALNSEKSDWSNVREFDGGLVIANNTTGFESAIKLALEARGFTAKVVIELSKPENIRLRPGRITSRLNNSNTEVSITPDLDIEFVAPGSTVSPQTESVWEDRFIRIAELCLENDVSTSEFYKSVGFDEFFKRALTPYLEEYGWRITRLKCQREPTELHKSYEKVDITWESIDEHSVTIGFQAILAQAAEDVPKYEDAGRPDFREWFKETVGELTQDLLLKKDIGALAPESIGEFKDKMNLELSRAAEQVGLTVEFLVAEPDIEEWHFLYERRFGFKETFDTLEFGEPIDLNISFTGRFTGADEMLEFVPNKGRDSDAIKRFVEAKATEAVAKVMGKVTHSNYLEDFYEAVSAFDPYERPDDHFIDASATITKNIENAIKEALKASAFECTDVTVRPDNEKLEEELKAIDDCSIREIDVIASPSDVTGEIYQVPFTILLRVERPDSAGYPVLLRKGFDVEEIDRALRNISSSVLSSCDRLALGTHLASEQHDETYRSNWEETLRQELATKFDEEMQHFGVSVSISSINRGKSEDEISSGILERDEVVGERVERGKELERQRKRRAILSDAKLESEVRLLTALTEKAERDIAEDRTTSAEESLANVNRYLTSASSSSDPLGPALLEGQKARENDGRDDRDDDTDLS